MNSSTIPMAQELDKADAPDRSALPAAIVTGAIAGALVALVPTLQSLAGEDAVSTGFGVIFGGGLGLLLVYTARSPKRPRRHMPALLWMAALCVFFIGGIVLGVTMPSTTISVAVGALVGILVAALVFGARHTHAQQEAQARVALTSCGSAAVPVDGTGAAQSYSPQEALADITSSYGALADRAITPKWYYPVVAVGLSGLTLAVGLDAPWWVTLSTAAASLAISLASVFIYRRMTGLTFTEIAPGRARVWFFLTTASMLGGVLVALAAASAGSVPLAIVAALVPLVGVPVCGPRYDACLRDAIRAGEYMGGAR